MMKIVLFLFQTNKTDNKSLFQKSLYNLGYKIIEIFGYCSFDCTNFEESLLSSISNGKIL